MAPLRLRALVLIVIAALAFLGVVQAAPTFPSLTGRVVDQANTLESSVRMRLETKLAELETKTGAQLVVVTLRSLQGYDIADYGYQLGRHWGLGERGKNNGALLIVAPTERKVRIEVGYGLEGTLTDAVSRLIIDNAILPRFRAGDLPGGVERGVDDVIQVLSGDAEDFKRRAAERAARPSGPEGAGSFGLVVLILALWLLLFLRARRQRLVAQKRSRWWWGAPAGGVWLPGGWGGGWPSGRRSGGGFSGGGGSFGGGGSSGSW